MITAVIIDDEQKNVGTLAGLLHAYCQQVTVIGAAGNAAGGRKLIEESAPQLVFLDVEMPYGSGFDMLQAMPGIEAEIIFVTAFNQYALNAFRYAALDYLLKPVDIEQLIAAVARAEKRLAERNTTRNYELLLKNIGEKDPARQSVAIADKGQQYFLPVADIMYIIADGSYTHIHTGKRQFVSTRLLKEFESLLPADMFNRIHHGHLVNKNYIARIERGRGGCVVMKDGRKLEIAIRRKDGFLKMMKG